MRSFGILLAVLALIAFVTVMNSFYTVRQDQQALVLQFGRPVAVKNVAGTDEAGLYFKLPLMQTVVLLDKKNIGYNLRDLDVLASDQRRLEVDAFVRWRISDPINFYQRLRTEGIAGERIDSFTESALRGALGQVPVPEIVSGQRAELMQRIRDEVNVNMEPFGVDIIDVRIRQADLPQSIAVGVYDRMKSAREQEAARIRAEGEEQARLIRARANREAQVLEAQARQ
ncbi:MAG: protease modulator HflC, partial [Pseudomonadota bacterium]